MSANCSSTEYEKDILEDFFYISENSKTKILDNVISLSTGRLKKYGNYDFLKSIQVITPTKKGELGTKELNKLLQEKINPYQQHRILFLRYLSYSLLNL